MKFTKVRGFIYLSLLAFMFIPMEVSATHLAGGYLRLICVGGNDYIVELIKYKEACAGCVPLLNSYTIFYDPVNANEGVDKMTVATRIAIESLDIEKTGPCHAPPEGNKTYEKHTYQTPPITLDPAASGYNIYTEEDFARNYGIVNIVGTGPQTLFLRSADRQEFPCNSSPEFINYPPVEICVDDTLEFDYSAYDPDGGLDTGTVTILSNPNHGTATVDPVTGEVQYVPNAGYIGLDSLTYEICDKSNFGSHCEEATVYLEINYQNLKPQATNDLLVTTMNNVVQKDILSNDLDFDGVLNPYSIKVLESVNNGGLFYFSGGIMEYIPDEDYSGIDSFSYAVCDAGNPMLCDTATGFITVAPAMDAPLAVDDYLTLSGSATNIDVLDNDQSFISNIDNSTLEIIQPPEKGIATIIANIVNYQATDKSSGIDSFKYMVCNDLSPASCDSAFVYITREAQDYPPVAIRDTASTIVNTSKTIDVLANDLDKVETLDYSGVSITTQAEHGFVNVFSGYVEYTPESGYYGIDSFHYRICDGGDENYCDETTVYVLVIKDNFKPVAVDDAFLIDPTQHPADSLLVLANDFDRDHVLSVDCDSTIFTDTIYRDSVIFDRSMRHDLEPDSSMMAAQGIDYFDMLFENIESYNIDSTYTYDTTEIYDTTSQTPLEVDTIYDIDTTLNTSNEFLEEIDYKDLVTDPFYIDLFQVDPSFYDTLKLLDELVNKACIDGGFMVIEGPSHGTVSEGYPVFYNPDPGFSGIDTLRYMICDGGNPDKCVTAMVLLFVEAQNFLPYVAADTLLPFCFEPAEINVLANDFVWTENINLGTLQIIDPPKHGEANLTGDSTFTYYIDSGYVGTDSFTYIICDENGDCDSNTVYVNASVVNLPPFAENDHIAINTNGTAIITPLQNDHDPEGQMALPSFKLLTLPENGAVYLTREGELLYEPNAGFSGTDSFTYEICDYGVPAGCDQATIYIEVGSKDAPQAIDDLFMLSGFGPSSIDVLANDNGALDEQTLSIQSNPDYGIVVVDENNRLVYYPTDSSASGLDEFSYTICNSGTPIACDDATVTISLIYNEGPLVVDDNITVEYGKPHFFDPLSNDNDPDGNIRFATAEIVSPPANGILYVLADTGMVYVPDENFSGTDQFEYKVCDDGMSVICNTATVNISVEPNDPPEANDETVNVRFNAPTMVDVAANDTDPAGDLDPASVRVTTPPVNGSTALALNGSVYYHPDPDFLGLDSFKYQIADHANPLQTDEATAYLRVGYDPSLPLANPDFHNLNMNEYGLFSMAANDDPSIDYSTFMILDTAHHGNAYIRPNGELFYKPDTNFSGSDSLRYLVCQSPSQYNCDTAVVKFSVADVSYPVTANDDYARVYKEHFRDIFVLKNDIDKDRYTAGYTLSIVTPPAQGSATVFPNGAVRYNAAPGSSVADMFEYEVCDGLGCDQATVNVDIVSGANIEPTVLNDRYELHPGQPFYLVAFDNDFDPDQDSLAYRLCGALSSTTPYNRGNMPPFPTVPYAAPMSATYPVHSNPPLAVDPVTGMLSGVPTVEGAYVITVCVEEYKNGKFLGDTRSEIQVLIVECTKQPNAEIQANANGTIFSCDARTVAFQNQTPDINDYDFTWDFGVQGVISDTSKEVHPVFTYPDTGTYEATLTVAPGSACEDVAKVTVKVYDSPDADFSYSEPLCVNQFIQFEDESDPVNETIATWLWEFSPTQTYSGKIAGKAYGAPGTKTVKLSVTSTTGCSDEITKQIDINPSPTVNLPNDMQQICVGDTLTVAADYSPNASISWSPQSNLTQTSEPGVVDISLENPGGTQYTATATNQHGCSFFDQFTLEVLERPIVDAGDPQRLCHEESAKMVTEVDNASYTHSFNWEPAQGLSNTTIANPLASPDTTTTYTLTVSKDNGKYCVESDTVTIFADLPQLDLESEKLALCSNDYTRLSAITSSQRATFSWSPAGSLSDSTSQFPTASPDSHTTYTLTMYDSTTQCAVTDEITVEVIDVQESAFDAGNDTTICRGDTARLFGSKGSRYMWHQDSTLSCLCCRTPKAWPLEATTYTLTGLDTNGCRVEDTVRVFIHDNPDVEAVGDTTVCPGEAVDVLLSGAESYIWYNDTTKNCTNCQVITIQPPDSNDYVVGGIDTNGCETLDTVYVDIFPPPSTEFTSPPEICKGDSVQLDLQGADTYNWSPAGSLSDPTIGNPYAFPEEDTKYAVNGTDTNGCAYEDTIEVKVNSLKPGAFISDTAICIGDSITLFADGFSNYLWAPAASLSCDTCPNPVAGPTSTTEYEVFVADSNGCKDTAAIEVTVNDLPEIVLDIPADSICNGESVQLTASGGIDYNWTPPEGLSDATIPDPVAAPDADTDYSLTVTDGNGCTSDTSINIVVHDLPPVDAGADTAICFEDTMTLHASGADSFTWTGSNGQYISCLDCAVPVVAPEFTTTYTLTGYNEFGCVNTDSIEITVNPDPEDVTISEDTTICYGDAAQLSISGGDRYLWTPAASLSCDTCDVLTAEPEATELYSVQVFTDQGCYRYFDVEVAVQELPEATIMADTGLCLGTSIMLQAAGGNNYSWNPTTGLSDPTIANPVASPEESQLYEVRVSDELGCSDLDSVFVDVYIPQDPNAQPDTVICVDQPLTVSAENGVQYAWSPPHFFDDPADEQPSVIFTQSQVTQVLTVEIVDDNGCINRDSISAEVKPRPDFMLTEDVKIYEGTSTVLNIAGNDQYTWDPLTGIIDSGYNFIEVMPEDTTAYEVTAVTQFGCVAQDTVVVTPIPRLNIFVPNAFSPNGDGKNDHFRVKANDIFQPVEMKVFDRWGNLIFATDEPAVGWNGKVNGTTMPIGTYVYMLVVEDQLGQRLRHKGNVTLIR